MLKEGGEQVSKLIMLSIADEILEERICGRWIHKPSGRVYHTKFNPPKSAGKDDVTAEALTQRPDDTKAALPGRLAEYTAKTLPILQHYKCVGAGLVCEVDAAREIAAVRHDVLNML